MSQPQITTNISGQTVSVSIVINENTEWKVNILSKTNRGLGKSGLYSDYPYFVRQFSGSNSKIISTTEIPDDYVAVLSINNAENVSNSLFSVKPIDHCSIPYVTIEINI